MITKLPGFPENIIAAACHGRVTREDYENVLIPAVEAALRTQKRLRVYYEISGDFAGIDPSAVIEDFKVGVEHLTRWDRIALVADVDWIRNTVRAFGFLLPGRVKVFHADQAGAAREWITSP